MKEKQLRSSDAEAQTVSEEKRIIRFKFSDETPDRQGDIIRQKGWDLSNFKKNPVILFGHDSNEPPIGKVVEIGIETRGKGAPYLWGDVQFAEASVYEFADTVYKLAKPPNPYISATSVGFIPKSTIRVEDETERQNLGLGRFGVIFEKQELLEVSIVPVPANPNAVQMAVGKGIISGTQAKRFEDAMLVWRNEKSSANVRFTSEDETRSGGETTIVVDPMTLERLEEIREKVGLHEEKLSAINLTVDKILGLLEEVAKGERSVTVGPKVPDAEANDAALFKTILGELGRIAEKVGPKKS